MGSREQKAHGRFGRINAEKRRLLTYEDFDAMSGNESQVANAVAKKLKTYLDLQRREQSFDLSVENELEVCFQNYKNSRDGQKSKANILVNEVKKMQSMKQLTDKEIATKKKLEIQMARHNNPFILSPYACPLVDGDKRIHKLMKKRLPKKRILSASRVQSAAPRPISESPKKPTNTEREQILNLTAKLLVATETVALPKNRHQSRESQTNTEEYFPSIPSASLIHGARAKSSYSDPGIHTLTKERVEKLNSPKLTNTQLKDELSSVDSGSLKSLNRTPFHVENCSQGYVVRKKPASYPSSLTSQNSRLSPRVPALSNNYTTIEDKAEDLESFDDDYFDHELTEPNRTSSNSDWFERRREKQLAHTSTQTIQNRGTQTYKQNISERDSFDDYLQDTVPTKNQPPNSHLNISTQIHHSFEGFSDNSLNEVTQASERGNISTQTQTNFDPKVITYQVYVITGDVSGASTSSDVKINIFGERGDSGDRPLLKSKTSKSPFQRGQIDAFDLDCKFLGKLTNIRVGHNGTAADDGWYLEKIHIKPGDKATKAYTFLCNKWLSAKEGDGQVMRDVTLTEETPIADIPPILPRKTLRCIESNEETAMSEAPKPKLLKSKATRDKLNNDNKYPGISDRDYSKSKDKKKSTNKNDRHSSKQTKMHHKISSSSSDLISSSTDTDTEKEKQKLQKQKRHDKRLQQKTTHTHEKPQANLLGIIDSITAKTNLLNVEDVYSTDTSISSHISSAYEKSLSEMRIASRKNLEKSITKHKNDTNVEPNGKLHSSKDSSGDSRSSHKHTGKSSDRRASLEPPRIEYSSHETSDNAHDIHNEKPVVKKGKKSSTKRIKKDISDDDKSRRRIIESPLHSKNVPFIESVIVPQEADMVHAAADTKEQRVGITTEKSEASSAESSEEINTTIANETEEEKVEFSLKDTKKQYSESDKDDLYMAGFRAAISATKAKDKNKELEGDAFHDKVKNGPTIHQACEDGDLDRLKELVDAIPDIKNKLDERGWAPIHISAAFGHLDMLKWLSISGVNLSQETRTGYTPIHLAAMNGHVNCIMILSAMGCSISSRTVDQFTPLHLAAMSGHIECVKWLLSNRAKIDATDTNGRTPLDLAEEYQHEECEKLLRILDKEYKRKDSAISLLSDPYALRRNSSVEDCDIPMAGTFNESEEDKQWLSDAEDTSGVVGRGGDERPDSQRRNSVQVGRKGSATNRVTQGPPKSASRRISKQEERQAQQLEEKKRNYAQQRKKLERKNSSFLDSIRQEIDGGEEADF